MADIDITKDLQNKKFILEYTLDGPRSRVWQAFTEKDLFERWWGPEGWETEVQEFSFIPGGQIHYAMTCVDDSQPDWLDQTSWGLMQIQEVNPLNSFTYKDYFSDEAGDANLGMPVLTITNEFIESGGKTKVVTTAVADTTAQLVEVIDMGAVEGLSSQLNKLDDVL